MPMYNLLEYSKNYSKTSGSLWNYYRDELADERNDNNNPNKNVVDSKYFKYKTNITGADGNPANNPDYVANKRGTKEVEIAVPLKHISNFWKMLDMPLISCDVSLALRWSANCVITSLQKD